MDHFDKKELKFKNIFKIYEKQHKKGYTLRISVVLNNNVYYCERYYVVILNCFVF